MKKIILAAFLMIGTPALMSSMSSCSTLGGMSGNSIQTISKVANIASTANQIANLLGINLGLNNNQQSSVAGIFKDYIKGSNGIASLAKSNKSTYAKKLSKLNGGTLSKLGDVLTIAQYAKLLDFGKKDNSNGSFLSGLKGGNDLSSSAVNVLSGLLLNNL